MFLNNFSLPFYTLLLFLLLFFFVIIITNKPTLNQDSKINPYFFPTFLAKGRTNVELREQFTLAPGASQSMTAFKAKRTSEAAPGASPNSSVSGGASGQPRGSISGPITKVMQDFQE